MTGFMLCLIGVMGCRQIPTQALVTITATDEAKARIGFVKVSVYRLTDVTARPSGDPFWTNSMALSDRLQFPLTVNLAPQSGSENGAFWVQAEGYEGESATRANLVAFAVKPDSFIEDTKSEVSLKLTGNCIDPLACFDTQTTCGDDGLCNTPPIDVPDAGVDGDATVPDATPDARDDLAPPRIKSPWNGTHFPIAIEGALGTRTIRWDPVDDADQYRIEIRRCTSTCTDPTWVSAETETEHTFGFLAAETEFPRHHIVVFACQGGTAIEDCGPPSDIRYVYLGLPINDANGDGKSDLIFSSRPTAFADTTQISSVSLESEETLFNATGVTDSNSVLAVGDLDNDGIADVAVGTSQGLFVYQGGASTTHADVNVQDLTIADVDGDEMGHVWLTTDANEVMRCTPSECMEISSIPSGTTIHSGGDLNGDGNTELVVDSTIYSWDGSAFTALFTLPSGATLVDIRSDFDSDGLAEIVYFDGHLRIESYNINEDSLTENTPDTLGGQEVGDVFATLPSNPPLLFANQSNGDDRTCLRGLTAQEGVWVFDSSRFTPTPDNDCDQRSPKQGCTYIHDEDRYDLDGSSTRPCIGISRPQSALFGIAVKPVGDFDGDGSMDAFVVARARTRQNQASENWDLRVFKQEGWIGDPMELKLSFKPTSEASRYGRLPK